MSGSRNDDDKTKRAEERKRLKNKIIELEKRLAENQDEIRTLKELLGPEDEKPPEE